MLRIATCRCGGLTATCTGEPVRISVCHCLECQKRSGSAFAVQARWPQEQVELSGAYHEWVRVGESGVLEGCEAPPRPAPQLAALLGAVVEQGHQLSEQEMELLFSGR